MTPQQIIQMLLQSPEALDILTGLIESTSGGFTENSQEEGADSVKDDLPEVKPGEPIPLSQEDFTFLSERIGDLRNQQRQTNHPTQSQPSFDPMKEKMVDNRGMDGFAERKVEDFLDDLVKDAKYTGNDALQFFSDIVPSYRDVQYGAGDIGRRISSKLPSAGDIEYGASDIGRQIKSSLPSERDIQYGAQDVGRKIASGANDVYESLIPSPAQSADLISQAVMKKPRGEEVSTLPQEDVSGEILFLSKPDQNIDALREKMISTRREYLATPNKKRNVRSVLDAMKRYNDALYERDRLI